MHPTYYKDFGNSPLKLISSVQGSRMKNLVQFVQPIRNYYLTVGLLLMLNCFSQPLLATTLTVNSLEDTTIADERCTLREALDNANHDNAGIGDCEAGNQDDVIDLSGLNGIITLSSQLEISSNLTLEGPGAEILTLDGDRKYLVLWIKSDTTVKIKGLKISRGYGGGVKNEGILTIEESTVSENWVDSRSGGIYNDGNLILTNSTVSENFASSWGGGIYNEMGTLTLNESTVSENSAGSWGGGIIITGGTSNLINSSVLGNAVSSLGVARFKTQTL
jgi:CSLREA domain-containing protein